MNIMSDIGAAFAGFSLSSKSTEPIVENRVSGEDGAYLVKLPSGFDVRMTAGREQKIVKRYEEQLAFMLNEVNGWYPTGTFRAEDLKRNHENFTDRLGALAKALGYGSFCELLQSEGYDVGSEKGTAARPAVRRISPSEAVPHIVKYVGKKIERALAKIDEWYPDKVVKGFSADHGKSSENLSKEAKNLGYEGWPDLLIDYGYTVELAKGGRPALNDFDAILAELRERYSTKEPAETVIQVREDNPDLAGKIKSMQNVSKEHFGKKLNEVLVENGILQDSGRRGLSDTELAGLEKMLNALVERSVSSEDKPRTLTQLFALDPECEEFKQKLNHYSYSQYGKSLAQYLREKGVLALPREKRPKTDLSDEEIEALFECIRRSQAGKVRPRNMKEFGEQNADFSNASASVKRYLKNKYDMTLKEFLVDKELISERAREDSIPRPSESIIADHYKSAEVLSSDELKAKSNGKSWVEFSSDVVGSVEYESAQPHEMLRIGDIVELEPFESEFVKVWFCGHDLGLINREDRFKYRLFSRTAHAEENGIVGGKIFATVTGFAGGPIKPKALISVYFVEDKVAASKNIKSGVLVSLDGKKALECIDPGEKIVIPEGVEELVANLFFEQPVRHVSLPESLKVIGDRAFERTELNKLRIPALVNCIGVGTFSQRKELEYAPGRFRDGGPIYIEVDSRNERYCSEDGSLYEKTDTGKRLLAFYYKVDRRRSEPKIDINIPEGTTCLASGFLAEPGCSLYQFRLHLPDSLVRIEEDAVPNAYVDYIYIGKNLADVAHDFWRYVGEDIPFIYSDFFAGEPKPLRKFPRGHSRVEIHPDNHNYTVTKKWFSINNVDAADYAIDEEEPAEEEKDSYTFSFGEGAGKVEYSFDFPKE